MGDEHDDKRVSLIQFIYNLAYHFRWFCIFKNFEKAIGRLVIYFGETDRFPLFITKLSVELKMSGKEILGIQETEEGRKIEISFERVASWALVFTNAFFVSYFFAKLLQWI